MQTRLQLMLAIATGGVLVPLRAADPARVDPAEQSRWQGATAPITMTPNEMPRADALMEKRVTPDVLEQARSSLLEQRAPIDLKEAQPKTIEEIKLNERFPTVKMDRETNAWSGQRAAWQTGGDSDLRPGLVERYQSRMTDASRAADRSAEMTTSRQGFGALNRFVFRRNRAVTDEPTAVPAGGARDRP